MLVAHDDEAVFRALADSTRRKMLDVLRAKPGLSITQLGEHFEVSRIAVTKHVRVLEAAELVITRVSGTDSRARELYINVVPLHRIVKRWSNQLDALFATQALGIKAAAEGISASKRRRTE